MIGLEKYNQATVIFPPCTWMTVQPGRQTIYSKETSNYRAKTKTINKDQPHSQTESRFEPQCAVKPTRGNNQSIQWTSKPINFTAFTFLPQLRLEPLSLQWKNEHDVTERHALGFLWLRAEPSDISHRRSCRCVFPLRFIKDCYSARIHLYDLRRRVWHFPRRPRWEQSFALPPSLLRPSHLCICLVLKALSLCSSPCSFSLSLIYTCLFSLQTNEPHNNRCQQLVEIKAVCGCLGVFLHLCRCCVCALPLFRCVCVCQFVWVKRKAIVRSVLEELRQCQV